MSDTNSKSINKPEEFNNFPFKTCLSFQPLIEFWEKELYNENIHKSDVAKIVLDKVNKVPELRRLIEDFSIIEKNKGIIDLLMSVIYPPAQWERQISASVVPFSFKYFYRTPAFKNIFPDEDITNIEKLGLDPKALFFGKIVGAYFLILEQLYNISKDTQKPLTVRKRDKESGLYSYYQLNIDTSFIRAISTGDLPELSGADINKVLNDAYNLELWTRLLPPEKFEFHGFVTFTAINVTAQEAISAIKFDLLEKTSIISPERFTELQENVRSLFMLPDLKIGIAAIPDDWSAPTYKGWKIGDSFILNDKCSLECSDYTGSVYGEAFSKNKPVIIEDLEKYENKGKVEEELLKLGIRNILVAPLLYKNKLIGAFEIGSPNPGDINSLNAPRIKSILPLFATAVKRNSEEFENQIQKIIKEKCTAVHPSVEWRFRRAAANLIINKETNKLAEMEPIVFENVYPLYGLSDIRNSSEFRNEAVQSDLIEHLNMAKGILSSAAEIKKLPLLDELIFRIEKNIKRVKNGLSSGDEIIVLEFLRDEIESVFDHISKYDPSLRDLILNYKASMDANHNSLYIKRKYYDESINRINETISSYLDECDEEAQEMFPHYFEKYKTDGVEHGIYIGASLVENRDFDMIYLKNMRLWQLMVMCSIVQKVNELKSKLKTPLETSHLILVQNIPLSITFRSDERKFDVAGTYNLRYEIMKKRIDKALIKGTKERLTQPGKIAIVYSHAKEAKEYKRYIEYLESIGNTKCNLEEFDLEDLQGMYGLRALRFTVNLDSNVFYKRMNIREISGTVNSLQEILNQ